MREVAVAAVLVRRGAAVAAGPLVEELHVVRRVRRPAPRRMVARHAARSSPDQQREEVCEPLPAWTRAALSLQPDIRIPSIATPLYVLRQNGRDDSEPTERGMATVAEWQLRPRRPLPKACNGSVLIAEMRHT